MSDVELTPEQDAAVGRAVDFLDRRADGELKIGGYAGTGKTTIVKAILARSNLNIAVAALTGKAVSVLRRKGVAGAQTLHQLIYKLDSKTMEFYRKLGIPFDAVLVDEASMIDRILYDDLRHFGLPTIFVGDMGQLEPVGQDINLMAEPDVRLEAIHRQAEGDPIVEFSIVVREDRPFWRGTFGSVSVLSGAEFWRHFAWADQIITARNATRISVNATIRANCGLRGLLNVGEKIICLKNNCELGVFNGMLLIVEKVNYTLGDRLYCDLRTEDDAVLDNLPILASQFGRPPDPELKWIQDAAVCDYGYALTCHKSQGSEWAKVLVLEERADCWDMPRWRYTAVTRASEELIYCR